MPKQHSPSWRVVAASFETSAPDLRRCPSPGLPEIAICGRSNVGKSSFINGLCGQKGLAKTSRTPGRTQLLNFFHLRLKRGEQPLELRCVDLPGYGHAQGGVKKVEEFAAMITPYMRKRDVLQGLVLLLDSRREIGERDLDLIELAAGAELQVLPVATKVDKLGKSERGLLQRRWAEVLGIEPEAILLTSAATGQGFSGELVDRIAEMARFAADSGVAGGG